MADTAHVIDDSQRTAAKVAGLACLLSYAVVVFGLPRPSVAGA